MRVVDLDAGGSGYFASSRLKRSQDPTARTPTRGQNHQKSSTPRNLSRRWNRMPTISPTGRDYRARQSQAHSTLTSLSRPFTSISNICRCVTNSFGPLGLTVVTIRRTTRSGEPGDTRLRSSISSTV